MANEKKITAHVYLLVDKNLFGSNNGGAFALDNTASVSGTFAGNTATNVTAKATASTTNTILKKTGGAFDSSIGGVTWSVNINQFEAPLGAIAITDTIPADMTVDIASVKVYEAVHDGKGVITGKGNLVTTGYSAAVTKDNTGKQILTINFQNLNDAYVLEYATTLAGATTRTTFTNNIAIGNAGGNIAGTTASVNISASQSNAFFTTRGRVHLTIKDEDGNPLEGVLVGLYSDAGATALIRTGTTDASGLVTLYGLVPGTTYYIKEISVPTGFALSSTILTVTPADPITPEWTTNVTGGTNSLELETPKAAPPVTPGTGTPSTPGTVTNTNTTQVSEKASDELDEVPDTGDTMQGKLNISLGISLGALSLLTFVLIFSSRKHKSIKNRKS